MTTLEELLRGIAAEFGIDPMKMNREQFRAMVELLESRGDDIDVMNATAEAAQRTGALCPPAKD